MDRDSTLGLKSAEIEWLRANQGTKEADALINQYQMVVVCPRDPGARGVFSAMLDEARKGCLAGVQ